MSELLLLNDDVRTMLKIALVFLLALLFWLRLYLAAIEDAELETLKAAPLRIVTEEDFDVAFRSMDEEQRLSAQRRAEGQSWIDYDEDFRRESA